MTINMIVVEIFFFKSLFKTLTSCIMPIACLNGGKESHAIKVVLMWEQIIKKDISKFSSNEKLTCDFQSKALSRVP